MKKEGKYNSNKRQRLLDSDEEDISLKNNYDKWLEQKHTFSALISNLFGLDTNIAGFGIPNRTQSYILGESNKWMNEEEYNNRAKQRY